MAIVQTRLCKGNCNRESQTIRERASDVMKESEIEVSSPAKNSDVLIKNECGIHDDAMTCYLVYRDFDLGISNFDEWYSKGEKVQRHCWVTNSIDSDICVETEATEAEPGAQCR